MPTLINASLTNIELDQSGRVLLPLILKGKTYKVLFDTGSSLFPLLITDDKISSFSALPGIDTIAISSWGTNHNVIGRTLKDSFKLAGQTLQTF